MISREYLVIAVATTDSNVMVWVKVVIMQPEASRVDLDQAETVGCTDEV
jgi:hypothetical protein